MSNSTPIAPDLDSLSLQRLMASLSLLQINYDDVNFDAGVAGSGASVWQMPETRNAFGFDVEGFSSLDPTIQQLLSPSAASRLASGAATSEIQLRLDADYEDFRSNLETIFPSGVLKRDVAGITGNNTGVSLTAAINDLGRYVVFVDGVDEAGVDGEAAKDLAVRTAAIDAPNSIVLNNAFADDFAAYGGFEVLGDGTFGSAGSLADVPPRIAQVMAYIQFVNELATDIASQENISKAAAYSKIDTFAHSAGTAGLIGNA